MLDAIVTPQFCHVFCHTKEVSIEVSVLSIQLEIVYQFSLQADVEYHKFKNQDIVATQAH